MCVKGNYIRIANRGNLEKVILVIDLCYYRILPQFENAGMIAKNGS